MQQHHLTHIGARSCTHNCNWVARILQLITATTCNNMQQHYLTHIGACSCNYDCNWVACMTATAYPLVREASKTAACVDRCMYDCDWVTCVTATVLHVWLQLSCIHDCAWVALITANYNCDNMQQHYSIHIGARSCTHHCNWVARVTLTELHACLQVCCSYKRNLLLDTNWCM